MNFQESGQSWCWQGRTVSSSEGVVESSSELEAKSGLLPRTRTLEIDGLTAIAQLETKGEGVSDVAGSRVSQLVGQR